MTQTEILEKLADGILKLSLPQQYYIAGLVEGTLNNIQKESHLEGEQYDTINISRT